MLQDHGHQPQSWILKEELFLHHQDLPAAAAEDGWGTPAELLTGHLQLLGW
jgi:hypothetical protein